MFFFDTNSHVDLIIDLTPQEIFERARCVGVSNIMVSGLHPDQWSSILNLAKFGYHNAFGLHPLWSKSFCERDSMLRLTNLLTAFPSACIGEIGLDARSGAPSFDKQKAIFEGQLQIAKDLDKAVIIHIVKAYGESLKILRKLKIPRFMIHNFAGSLDIALEFMNLGGYLSVSGVATRKNACRIRKILSELPLERLVLESDAPDL